MSRTSVTRGRRLTVYYHPGCWQRLFYEEGYAFGVGSLRRFYPVVVLTLKQLDRVYSSIKRRLGVATS
ncbi:MAG: hypothetical protein ACE5OY_08795 [Candidatus Bathyarchaeia archaeon]